MSRLKKLTYLLILTPIQALAQEASTIERSAAIANLRETGRQAGFFSTDLKLFIGNIIRIVLGFVGIIFIALIIWGGIEWMTSGGNEQKIEMAKKRLQNATIGLVIIVAAYAIASFVVGSLEQAIGTSDGGLGGGGGA